MGLELLEKYFNLEMIFDDEDMLIVIANHKEGTATFKYIAKFKPNAKEYLEVIGINVGTIIYDNYYRYIVNDDLTLKYLFNDTKSTEEEVQVEIQQLLKDINTNIAVLKEIMKEYYENTK